MEAARRSRPGAIAALLLLGLACPATDSPVPFPMATKSPARQARIVAELLTRLGVSQALLSLLLKKQLIADWEFVEEYKKL